MLGYGVRKTLVFGVVLSLLSCLVLVNDCSAIISCRRTRDIAVDIVSYYNFQGSESMISDILRDTEFKNVLAEIANKGCKKIYVIASGSWPSGGRVFNEQHVLTIEKDIGFKPEIDSACIILPFDFTDKSTLFEQREVLAHELGHILKTFDAPDAEADYMQWRVAIDGVNNFILDSYAGDEESFSRFAEDYLTLFALRLEDVALLRYQISRGNDFSVQSAYDWADSTIRDLAAELDGSGDSTSKNLMKWQFVFGYYCSILPFELEGVETEARKEQFIETFSPHLGLGEIYGLIAGPANELRSLLENNQYPSAYKLISALKALP